ncbi:type II secretion system F family protein [Patescibacteria group bacterium]|nr:type II secretion system F family protein [Patescibacteria group bacterium]
MFFVSQKEKMFFAEHLSLMIKGGIPLTEALETLKNETKSKTFKKTLNNILKRILEGERLNKSLGRYPKIFDKFFCNVVKVGEESGTLEENLKYLAGQIRSDYEMKKKVSGALIYPVIIITMALIIALVVTLFILPKITNLFQFLEVELPLTTRVLIGSTFFFKKYWIFIIIGIIFLISAFRILQRFKSTKFYFDKISFSLPFFSQIFKGLNLARFSRTLYTLLKSRMPILEALEICADTLPNEVFKRSLILVRSGVERGEKISQGFKRFPQIFPPIFSQMVVVGERSGALEESFLYLAEFHEGEVDSILKNLSGILEPILLILVGAFVAFVALAIITPIYRFIGAFRFR